jgi:hypothetical protein
LRLGDIFGRDDGAAARLVVDDDGLAEAVRQFLSDDPRDEVVAAAPGVKPTTM